MLDFQHGSKEISAAGPASAPERLCCLPCWPGSDWTAYGAAGLVQGQNLRRSHSGRPKRRGCPGMMRAVLPSLRDPTAPCFRIAWISASTISIRRAPPEWFFAGSGGYELTDVLARYLVGFRWQACRVCASNLLQGARTQDMRRAVLAATAAGDVDVFIVEINPIWLTNDYLQFTLSRQRAGSFPIWRDLGRCPALPHGSPSERNRLAFVARRHRCYGTGSISQPV